MHNPLQPAYHVLAPAQAGSRWPNSMGGAGSEFKRAMSRVGLRSTDKAPSIVGASDHQRSAKAARVEAALFVADGALSLRRLSQIALLADDREAQEIVDQLNNSYDEDKSAFRIERVATGYRLLTRAVFSRWLSKIHQRQSELKLSPPAMETLTIVAYRQPITRADVEQIRGVQCSEMLKQLMERGMVRIVGEDDSLGRPYLYGTTRQFFEIFGLTNLNDLPMADELRRVDSPVDPEPEEEIVDPSLAEEETDDEDLDDAEIDEEEFDDDDEEEDLYDDDYDDEDYEDEAA